MLKRMWEYFLLTMGVTPRGAEGGRADKWAEARRLKERQDRQRRERENAEDREARSGGPTNNEDPRP